MSDKPIVLTIEDGIAEIRLNRPKVLNAITRDMLKMLRDYVAEIAARDDVGVCVIAGEGRGFCAGADLTDPMMGGHLPRPERAQNCIDVMDGEINAMVRDFHVLQLPKLTIVNGIARTTPGSWLLLR